MLYYIIFKYIYISDIEMFLMYNQSISHVDQLEAISCKAWPLVQVSDCQQRCVTGVAALRMPLQELSKTF